jgi:hypothetical protein
MDFLDFANMSFCASTNIGQLCQDLKSLVGLNIWYDTFQIKYSKWLWLVSVIFATINTDTILWGSFGLYSSYAAGILNSVEKIHFFVLCYEQLNYGDYIKKCVASKDCSVSYKAHTGCYFKLSSCGKTVALSFEARIIYGRLPSSLIFAQGVFKKYAYHL